MECKPPTTCVPWQRSEQVWNLWWHVFPLRLVLYCSSWFIECVVIDRGICDRRYIRLGPVGVFFEFSFSQKAQVWHLKKIALKPAADNIPCRMFNMSRTPNCIWNWSYRIPIVSCYLIEQRKSFVRIRIYLRIRMFWLYSNFRIDLSTHTILGHI